MGLGSILGTGVFVSIGIGAGVAGSWVLPAVAIAALVATFNGLSSAQLAASHPVSGGTYEYGYRYLSPSLGFTAGWMFLCAKSASAATAALGLAGYILGSLGQTGFALHVGIALAAITVLTAIVASGIRHSNRTNAVIVSLTLVALGTLVASGIATVGADGFGTNLSFEEPFETPSFLHATALMFVAYTGYGRIATLGEEIREPKRNIPRAIVVTLLASMVIYVAVTAVGIGVLGAEELARATDEAASPLKLVAQRVTQVPGITWVVWVGAITAMAGVLLNLLLGLSRVLLAMGRRGDMPQAVARVDDAGSPRTAVIVVGAGIALLASLGSVKLAWSFSAFTVLVYYALTNLAALRLPVEHRRFPRWVSALGLASCAGLAFWVESEIWLVGLGVIAAGLAARTVLRRRT